MNPEETSHLSEPSSKRRRVSATHKDTASLAGYSSVRESATLPRPEKEEDLSPRRALANGATGQSPRRRGTSNDGELKAPYDSPSHSPTPRTRRSRSKTGASRSPRSRSRSHSQPRYRSRSQSGSKSPRSRTRSRTRSDSTSSTRSDRSPSSPRSLSEKVDRHLRLSRDASSSAASATPPHPRRPVRPDYQPHLSLEGHRQPVSQVRFSPDGRWIASASADGTVKIWDAATGEHMDTLVGHMAGVSCVAWSPDGDTLATGSDDKAIRLWDRVTGRPQVSAKGVAAAAAAAAAATNRGRVNGVGEGDVHVDVDMDGGIVATTKPMPPLLGHHNYVMCLAFSPKGNILASGSYDEAVFLWDVRAGRLMRSLPAHSDPVSGIDFCLDGTLVVSCSTDGLIRIWDTYTGQCLRTLVHEDNPAVTAACFAPNGRYVLAFNLDNCIRLWDYVSGSVKKTYQGHRNSKFAVGGCFGLLPTAQGGPVRDNEDDDSEGAFVASASEDGDVLLWDVSTKEVVQRIHAHHGQVCFWVDVRGGSMVTGAQDGTVKVFRHRWSAGGGGGNENGGPTTLNGTENGDGNGHVETGTQRETGALDDASEPPEPRIKIEDTDMEVDGPVTTPA